MIPRSRRKRAIVRDRRRGWSGITPLIGPLNGHDLFLISRYAPPWAAGDTSTMTVRVSAE